MIGKLFKALFGWLFSAFRSENKLIANDSVEVATYIKGVDFRPDRAALVVRNEPILHLTGTFFNQDEATIELLEVKITAFDGQNVVGESETEVVGSHQADLQQGDSQAWEFRMPLKRAANRAEISTVALDHSTEKKAAKIGEAKIDWDVKVPMGVAVVFNERLHRTQAFGDGSRLFCHLTVEVQNTGSSVRVLKLELSFFDKENKTVDTREALAAWTGGPALQPGERRLVHVISKVPSNYSHYSGRVVEAL